MSTTTHWLLVRPSVHNGGPHVLGSYRYRKDADSDQAALGGTLLELDFWEESDPAHAEGLTFAGEWLLPDD